MWPFSKKEDDTHAYLDYANGQEQGSFCNTESKRHYDNVNAVKAANIEASMPSTHMDRDGSDDPEELYQRHNVWYAGHDDHHQPYDKRADPGR